jgi:hypothetical protein
MKTDSNQPWMKSFIPLPSNPAELTIEHLRTAFVGDWNALKEVKKVARETVSNGSKKN